MTQKDLIAEYYLNNPGRDIPHAEIVDWATNEWAKRTGQVFRDPDRAIRSLYQDGLLIKVEKGVYRYECGREGRISKFSNFTARQKKEILERDGYKCVICGRGLAEGIELHIDHIKPRFHGGESTLANGQTLCSRHNMFKKNMNQTETGKKMFMRLLEVAKEQNDDALLKFCEDILEVYQLHNMNSHIDWKK